MGEIVERAVAGHDLGVAQMLSGKPVESGGILREGGRPAAVRVIDSFPGLGIGRTGVVEGVGGGR
jgi:hypothetical protein